jgi:hypothetical protein
LVEVVEALASVARAGDVFILFSSNDGNDA